VDAIQAGTSEKGHDSAERSAAVHVLVVEDDSLMRWAVTETLGNEGYGVVAAADCHEAREVLQKGAGPIDVVMLDYLLPDCHDLSLLSTIRREAPGANVILMTAFADKDIVNRALELGACSVVLKPFEMSQVGPLVAAAHAVRATTAANHFAS
jgi:DNA-binding NtrC family response regulator